MQNGEFSLPVRVYIEDTDAGGIVYYVNYLKFMERARTEMMRSLGFAKVAVSNEGVLFVVKDIAVDYRAPAQLDDELVVSAKLVSHGAARLCFEQRVERQGQTLVEATVTVACVAAQSLKPRRLPKNMFAVLTAAM